ncbi:radical SAM protein [Rhodoferax sp. U11-2br]|nr:radical SAM protein [Rhodoferax sp. U11-2br]MBT3068403.1 radical SAM protein [Rhodoferax sp. U11-2br]
MLYQRGARNFKFVDRTFNLKIEHSVRILQFFLDHLPAAGASANEQLFLHFEVIPDHLPERLKAMLRQFPLGVLQLEVGVQSFNAEVQHTISRRQDNAASEANLRWLLTHSHAHLHADLIFGLPGETLHSFAEGFDRLLAIGPHEIQLGVLKRLRGAPVARHSDVHGMVYDPEPPYTVSHTGVVDADTVQRFTRLVRYWDLLVNSGRFARTLVLLLQTPPADVIGALGGTETEKTAAQTSPFWRFWLLSDWLWQRLGSTHKLTPELLVDTLFAYLSQSLPPESVRQALLADYLSSGARANPQALQGLLPRQPPAPAKAARTLAARQERHRV